MTYKAQHRDSAVFAKVGKKRQSITPGLPIPPGGFRRQNTAASVNKSHNASAVAGSASSSRLDERLNERPVESMTAEESAAAEDEALVVHDAQTLSQELSSQLTLAGGGERHPGQCTPSPALMCGNSPGVTEDPLATAGGGTPTLNAQSLFVREDTDESTSTSQSQLEAQKYQAIVDRINDKMDEDDPTFELPDETVSNPKSRASSSKKRVIKGADARTEDVDIGDYAEPCPRANEAGNTIKRINTWLSDSNEASSGLNSPTGSKRRSPDPDLTNSSKRMRCKRAGRKRTCALRFCKLEVNDQDKRMNILADIQIIWSRRCQDVIPEHLWLRGGRQERLPLPPIDWPVSMLKEMKRLAQNTWQRSDRVEAALVQAVAQQAAKFDGKEWLRCEADVKLAVKIAQMEESSEDDDDEQGNHHSSDEELRSVSSTGADSPERRSPPVTPTRRDSNRVSVVQQQDGQVSRNASPQEESTAKRRRSSAITSSSGVSIKQEPVTPSQPPTATGPAFLATLNPTSMTSLCEDEAYRLKLHIEDEIERRKCGGKPNAGVLSSWKLADLTSQDLSRLSALDFHRLRKMVDADWERREVVGTCPENAMVID